MLGMKWDIPLAPFATGSTDELLDDKVKGLTTQNDHSKGDIVVCGNELVTNGTFETDTDWSYNDDGVVSQSPTGHISGGVANIVSTGTFQSFNQNIGDTSTAIRLISFEVTRVGSGSIKVIVAPVESGSGGIDLESGISTVGFHTVEVQSSNQWLIIGRGTACDIDIDNISVKLKDQSYIATEDTTAGDLLSGSKFKAIPYCVKHTALLIKKDNTGTVSNIALPLKNVYGEESVETYENDIFTDLGFSQLKDRVFTDGTNEYILIGIKTHNNSLAYSPIYNPFGSRKFSDDLLWYETADAVGSLYDCA